MLFFFLYGSDGVGGGQRKWCMVTATAAAVELLSAVSEVGGHGKTTDAIIGMFFAFGPNSALYGMP